MIYYSHVNEDNNVERNICIQEKIRTTFCITGSGERLISLMDNPYLKKIIAIDINKEAQFLLELKLKALENLEVTEYLSFIGYYEDTRDRLTWYNQIKLQLSIPALEYWDKHLTSIKKGIINIGHFESYIRKLRPVTAIYLGNGFYDCFEIEFKNCPNFPITRWNLLLKLLSNVYFLRLTGNKDIAFTASNCDGRIISEGLYKTLKQNMADKSFMFNLIFKGHLREMNPKYLPPSLQPELLQKIKTKINDNDLNINYLTGDLKDVICSNLDSISPNTFFSLSDILSFVKPDYLAQLLRKVKGTNPESLSGVFRSFLKNDINQVEFMKETNIPISDLTEHETTNMYKVYGFNI